MMELLWALLGIGAVIGALVVMHLWTMDGEETYCIRRTTDINKNMYKMRENTNKEDK